jgi:signal peptidase I
VEDAAPEPAAAKRRGRRFWILVGLGVVVAAWVIFTAVFGRYVTPSESMEPTLRPGDHILVYRYSAAPSRGDIVAVHPRGLGGQVIRGAATESSLLYVERVVGLPGETVMIRRNHVEICRAPGVGCHRLHEPYLFAGDVMPDYGPVTIPAGEYLLMGDHRNLAEDSRFWGPAPRRNIVGAVVAVYWPLGRFTIL